MKNKKMCCFYLNNIHLVTMLLPYINERINGNTQIITCFEEDLSQYAERVISSIYGKNVKKLLKIDWRNKDISEIIKSNIENSLIIVSGKKDFIKMVNDIAKRQNCEILNCYELLQGKIGLNEILEEHDYVVNTSGESKVEDIFTKRAQKNYIS